MRQLIIAKELYFYSLPSGKKPFLEWLRIINDAKTYSKIQARLARLRLGHYGNYKMLGSGIYELKLAFGPGYRIYFGELKKHVILLLVGGDKSSQARDILQARDYWQPVKVGNYIYE